MSAASEAVMGYPSVSRDRLTLMDEAFDALIDAVAPSAGLAAGPIVEAARMISACLEAGGKLLACGNGGSAAAAQHFCGEMVGRFRQDGAPPRGAIALTADSAVLTGWSEETGYADVFARQVEALGRKRDVLLCVTTSGRSPNVVRACERAGRLGISRIVLAGPEPGALADLAEIIIPVAAPDSQRIQEAHLFILHAISELVERGTKA